MGLFRYFAEKIQDISFRNYFESIKEVDKSPHPYTVIEKECACGDIRTIPKNNIPIIINKIKTD
jgi:hypothetical protein